MAARIRENGPQYFPSSKQRKRKMNVPIESLFMGNEKDDNECKDILEIMEKSQITKRLNISRDINKEIAEFATGRWETCECDESVSILHADEGEYLCPGCQQILKQHTCKTCHHNFVSTSLCRDQRGPPPNLCFSCGEDICNDCEQSCECEGCGEVYCDDCAEPCNDCNDRGCPQCNGQCFKCDKGPTCYICTRECRKCGDLFCKDHVGIRWCHCCRGAKCDSCNNVIGICAICGEKVCSDCIKIGGGKSKKMCVCEMCCDQYKHIFKHL